MSAMLLSGYFQGIAGTSLVPEVPAQVMGLLDAFALERTLRDLREELGWSSPGRITPLRALVRMLESAGTPVAHREIASPHGHDSFLLESAELYALIRGFLERPEAYAVDFAI